jgi:hypothetical protein
MDCQVSSEHIGEFKGSAAVHVVEVWGVHPDCDADYSRATPDINCARGAMFDGIPGIEALKRVAHGMLFRVVLR